MRRHPPSDVAPSLPARAGWIVLGLLLATPAVFVATRNPAASPPAPQPEPQPAIERAVPTTSTPETSTSTTLADQPGPPVGDPSSATDPAAVLAIAAPAALPPPPAGARCLETPAAVVAYKRTRPAYPAPGAVEPPEPPSEYDE